MTESVLEHIEGQLIEALDAGHQCHLGVRGDVPSRASAIGGVAATARCGGACNGVSITGDGINPGFSFDSLPLMLARATSGVKRVNITRTIDVTGTGPGDIDHVG